MWSNLDKLMSDFIVQFEQALGKVDGDMQKNIPLDNLQLSITLDQQTEPAQIRWNVSVMQGGEELYDIGHHCEMPTK